MKTNQNKISLFEGVEILKNASGFLAAPVSLFLHRRIGYRELSPRWIIVVAIAMCAIATVFPEYAGPSPACPYVYAVIMVLFCFYQRYRRWNEWTTCMNWHSRSLGISWFEGLPRPNFLKYYLRTERFLEPAATMVAGLIVLGCLSKLLGAVIIVSGFFLHVFHNEVFKKELDRAFDDGDSIIESEIRAAIMKNSADAPYADVMQNQLDGAGLPIPSGMDLTMRQRIMQRRAALNDPPENG